MSRPTVSSDRRRWHRARDRRRDGPRRSRPPAARSTWERVDAGTGAVAEARRSAAAGDDRLDQADAARAQGAARDAERRRLSLGQRDAAPAVRLYANVRPAQTIPGVPSRYTNVDLVIVRENTEDLYAGIEHYIDPRRTAAESIAIITRFGSERVIVYAFEYARRHGRKKVTLVHKANILKMSNGLFLDTGREVAQRYPDIAVRRHDRRRDRDEAGDRAGAVRRDRHDEPVRRHPVAIWRRA